MDRIIMDNITDNIKDNIKANIAFINKNDTNNDIKEMNNESENNFKNNSIILKSEKNKQLQHYHQKYIRLWPHCYLQIMCIK